MSECRKHPGIWTRREMYDSGEKEGQYGLYCPACQTFCEDCEEKKVGVKTEDPSKSEAK